MPSTMTNRETAYQTGISGVNTPDNGNVAKEDESGCEVSLESKRVPQHAVHGAEPSKASLRRDREKRIGWVRNYPNILMHVQQAKCRIFLWLYKGLLKIRLRIKNMTNKKLY